MRRGPHRTQDVRQKYRHVSKGKEDLSQFIKILERFHGAREDIEREVRRTNLLVQQGARSSKVKTSLPSAQELKDAMNEALKEQRTLVPLEFLSQFF